MIWLAAVGMALKFAGQMNQAKSEAESYYAAAQADRYSAAIARQRGEMTQQFAYQYEDQIRRESRIAAGERRAAIGQSGTGFSGSNLDIERQSEIYSELDALNIRYQGNVQKFGLEQEAIALEMSAQSKERAGKSAYKSGFMGAAGGLLSGFGMLAGGGK